MRSTWGFLATDTTLDGAEGGYARETDFGELAASGSLTLGLDVEGTSGRAVGVLDEIGVVAVLVMAASGAFSGIVVMVVKVNVE